MKRIAITPRPDYAKKLEEIGFSYHALEDYWKEDACYQFTAAEVDEIEAATEELQQMCLKAVQYVIDRNRFADLGIPQAFWEPIKTSFARRDFHLYGRFDFAYDGSAPPKLLEYNADTPTSLLEAAVAQWYWLEEKFPNADQFNSLHEKLVERWKQFSPGIQTIHFASLAENEEDWVCAMYIMDTAAQAGFDVKHIFVEDIGWSDKLKTFVDVDDKPIEAMFKLYPWEWLVNEAFGAHVVESLAEGVIWIEPIWKMIWSNKAILTVLWDMFPDHPNLLEAALVPPAGDAVAKPLLAREGANVSIRKGGTVVAESAGDYGHEGYVYQAIYPLPETAPGVFPVIGSWIVDGDPAGIGIREDDSPITKNTSRFVPHYFID